MKKVKVFLFAIVAFAALALYGCGGGGGGSSSTTPPDTGGGGITPSSVTKTVSGTVTPATSLSSLVASAAVESAGVLDDAIVDIVSYDNEGNVIDRKSATLNEGVFAVSVNLWSEGGKIEITITKEGFSPFLRVFKYGKDEAKDLNVNTLLNQVVTRIIPVDNQSITISSNGKKYISFAIFKDKKGNRQILTAAETKIKIAANEGTPEYSMEIPTDKVKDNLSAIRADIKNFDPNNPTDMNNFPTSDSDDGDLITAGFDFTKLTDEDSGSGIFDTTKISAAAGEVVAYATKYVDCGNLLGDMTDNDSEYRVNVYVLKNGSWKNIGSAYIQQSWDNTTAKDPNNVCSGTNYEYARIEVTDPDFAWVNLDYPLSWLSGEATELCVNLQFKDQDNKTITKYINFDYADDDNVSSFSGGYGYAYNGEAKISVLASSTDDTSMKLSLYNPFSYVYQTFNNIPLSTTCDNYTITLDNPLQCQVQGVVTDNATGNPVSYQYIYAYNASNFGYYGFGYTDTNGEYSIDVPCDTNVTLYYYSNGYTTKSTKVDNSTNSDEVSDNGEIAVVNFTKENQKPYGYGYLSTYSPHSVNSSHTVYFYAYDYEGDYPISYTLKENGVSVATGTFSSTDWNYKSYTTTPTAAGNYQYSLELTDSAGKTATASLGTVEVLPAGNKPPVIATVFTSPTSTKVGKNLFFYYSIYDPDNDPMTIEFVVNSGPCVTDNTSQPAYYVTSDTAGTCNITMIVTDNNSKSDNATVTVTFTPNNPPVIYPYSYNQSARIGNTINLSAYVYDPDGDSLTYTWADNCSGGNVSGSGMAASITSNTVESCQVTLTASDGIDASNYVYNVTFTDNNPPAVTINVDNPTPKPGDTIALTCNAVDPDGDGIASYMWTNSYDNTTANTYNFSYQLPNSETTITFTCEATDDFSLNPKTGTNEIEVNVTAVPTNGNITITNVK